MKKLFAIFLILAMLIPMGLVAQAETVTIKPFYVLSNDVEVNVQYIYQRPKTWINKAKLTDDAENMPVLFMLSKYAVRALDDFVKQRKAGKDPVFLAKNIGLPHQTDYWQE
jgi:hypothetical protein